MLPETARQPHSTRRAGSGSIWSHALRLGATALVLRALADRSGMWYAMGMAKSLAHPGWVGVVLPIILTGCATFSPEVARGLLLVLAVVAATWTFYCTDYAGKNIGKTGVAAALLLTIAVVIFIFGHVLDARSKLTTPLRPETGRAGPPPEAPITKEINSTATKTSTSPGAKKTKRNATALTPSQANPPEGAEFNKKAASAQSSPVPQVYGMQQVESGGTGYQANGPGAHIDVNAGATIPKLKASLQTRKQSNAFPPTTWETMFVVTTNVPVSTSGLRVVCSGPVAKGNIGATSGVISLGDISPDPKDKNALIINIYEPSMIIPGRPLWVFVYSMSPVTVTSGAMGGQPILFPMQ